MVCHAKLQNGKNVLILCGTFYPNFDINEIDNGDEMWVCDIEVKDGGVKFTKPKNISFSPEDFLEGTNQSPNDWKNKCEL